MNGSLALIQYNSSHINSSSLISEEELEEIYYMGLYPLVAYTLIVAGTIGNSLVCLAILLDKKLQNLANYFLFSLAVTDLLVASVIIPARMAIRHRFQPESFPFCLFYFLGDGYSFLASAIHICFISSDRYFAIKNPFDRMKLSKKKVAIKMSLVWIVSLLPIIPGLTLAILTITKLPNKPMFCAEVVEHFMYIDAMLLLEDITIVVMIIVVVTSFVLTSILLRKLARRQQERLQKGDTGLVRNVGGKKSVDKSQALQNEQKALRVVWIVSFAFIITLGFYLFIDIISFIFPGIIIPDIVYKISSTLSYVSCVINPIVNTIFNKTFRTDFKNLLLFKCQLK